MAAWRGVRRDRRILGSVGAGSARCLVTKKFLVQTSIARINIRSDHIHVDTVDMDTSLLAEPKDHQLARLERASREPGHPSQPSTQPGVRTAQPACVNPCFGMSISDGVFAMHRCDWRVRRRLTPLPTPPPWDIWCPIWLVNMCTSTPQFTTPSRSRCFRHCPKSRRPCFRRRQTARPADVLQSLSDEAGM